MTTRGELAGGTSELTMAVIEKLGLDKDEIRSLNLNFKAGEIITADVVMNIPLSNGEGKKVAEVLKHYHVCKA